MTSPINNLSISTIEALAEGPATFGVVTLTNGRKFKVEVTGGDGEAIKLNINKISEMAINILIEQKILQESNVGKFIKAEISEEATAAIFEHENASIPHKSITAKANNDLTSRVMALFSLIKAESPEQRKERERQEQVDKERRKEEQRAAAKHHDEMEALKKKELEIEQARVKAGDELDELMRDLDQMQREREKEKKGTQPPQEGMNIKIMQLEDDDFQRDPTENSKDDWFSRFASYFEL